MITDIVCSSWDFPKWSHAFKTKAIKTYASYIITFVILLYIMCAQKHSHLFKKMASSQIFVKYSLKDKPIWSQTILYDFMRLF